MAICYLNQKKYEKAIIFTDIKSVLEKLNIPKTSSNKLIYEIIDDIEKVWKKRKKILLIWLKGHISIIGNETADERKEVWNLVEIEGDMPIT